MKKDIINIGVVGHIDQGKTALTAIMSLEASKGIKELKTIDEIIEEEKSYKFEAPLMDFNKIYTDFTPSKKVGKGGRARNRSKFKK